MHRLSLCRVLKVRDPRTPPELGMVDCVPRGRRGWGKVDRGGGFESRYTGKTGKRFSSPADRDTLLQSPASDLLMHSARSRSGFQPPQMESFTPRQSPLTQGPRSNTDSHNNHRTASTLQMAGIMASTVWRIPLTARTTHDLYLGSCSRHLQKTPAPGNPI